MPKLSKKRHTILFLIVKKLRINLYFTERNQLKFSKAMNAWLSSQRTYATDLKNSSVWIDITRWYWVCITTYYIELKNHHEFDQY